PGLPTATLVGVKSLVGEWGCTKTIDYISVWRPCSWLPRQGVLKRFELLDRSGGAFLILSNAPVVIALRLQSESTKVDKVSPPTSDRTTNGSGWRTMLNPGTGTDI